MDPSHRLNVVLPQVESHNMCPAIAAPTEGKKPTMALVALCQSARFTTYRDTCQSPTVVDGNGPDSPPDLGNATISAGTLKGQILPLSLALISRTFFFCAN